MANMMLLTKENRASLPALYTQEEKGADAIAQVKFFCSGRYTAYATEFDGDDTFFGFVVSALGPDCDEWGYFSLGEMEAFRGPFGGMERDRYFTPTTVRDAAAQHGVEVA